MTLTRMPSDKPPRCAVMEKAFEIAEASLRLEGIAPGPRYYALKERVLAGEVTPDQALAELMNTEHQQDMEIASEVMRDNREALRELGAAEPGSKFDRSLPDSLSSQNPGAESQRKWCGRLKMRWISKTSST